MLVMRSDRVAMMVGAGAARATNKRLNSRIIIRLKSHMRSRFTVKLELYTLMNKKIVFMTQMSMILGVICTA